MKHKLLARVMDKVFQEVYVWDYFSCLPFIARIDNIEICV
jgi:hypothetical protein